MIYNQQVGKKMGDRAHNPRLLNVMSGYLLTLLRPIAGQKLSFRLIPQTVCDVDTDRPRFPLVIYPIPFTSTPPETLGELNGWSVEPVRRTEGYSKRESIQKDRIGHVNNGIRGLSGRLSHRRYSSVKREVAAMRCAGVLEQGASQIGMYMLHETTAE